MFLEQKLRNAVVNRLNSLSWEATILLEELMTHHTKAPITIETLNRIQTNLFGKNDPSITQELFFSFLAPEQDIDWGTDLNGVNFCIPLSDALGEFYQSNSINIHLEIPLAGLQASYAEGIFRERIENGSFRRPVVIFMDNGTQLPDAVLEILSKKDLDNFLDNTQFPVEPFVEHMIRPIWVSDDTERFSIAIEPETYPGSLSEKVSKFFDVLNSDQLSSEQRDAVKASIRDLFKTKAQYDATKDSHMPAIVANIIDESTDISADALVEAIQHLYPDKDYRPDNMETFQADLYSVMSYDSKEISDLLRRVHYERFCENLKGQIADFKTRTFWDTLNQGSVLEASKAWFNSIRGG